jgi:hypothetical protein
VPYPLLKQVDHELIQASRCHKNEDVKGERGGHTGNTKQKGKGEKAEKGDQRRENPTHSGPKRRGNQDSDKNN